MGTAGRETAERLHRVVWLLEEYLVRIEEVGRGG